MAGWNTHNGTAVCLPQTNIDTDQIIPARFMSTPRAEGYGQYLLYDLRRDEAGQLSDDFPLNKYDNASVIVARSGFGSGSSREAAVYALVDAGIRAVIAPGFGDIFASNAVNNGLLPARVTSEASEALEAALANAPQPIHISIEDRCIALGGVRADFSLDDSWATKLINGWDDIDLTLEHRDTIAGYRHTRSQTAPWAWPAAAD